VFRGLSDCVAQIKRRLTLHVSDRGPSGGFLDPIGELAARLEERFDLPSQLIDIENFSRIGVFERLQFMLKVAPFALPGS
jgi:hypothetical protein